MKRIIVLLVTVCSAVIATSCEVWTDIIFDAVVDVLQEITFGPETEIEGPDSIGDYKLETTQTRVTVICDELGIYKDYVSARRRAYATGADRDDLYFRIYDDNDGRHFYLSRVNEADFPNFTFSINLPEDQQNFQKCLFYWGDGDDYFENHNFYGFTMYNVDANEVSLCIPNIDGADWSYDGRQYESFGYVELPNISLYYIDGEEKAYISDIYFYCNFKDVETGEVICWMSGKISNNPGFVDIEGWQLESM